MASAAAIDAATDDSDESADVAPSSEGRDQNCIVVAMESTTAEQLHPSDGGGNEHEAVGQQEQRSDRKRGRPRLINESKDKLIQDVMLQRGTTNARMIQDELARKHNVKLAYEVIRRRVKELSLQSGGGSSTPVVGVEASSESDEDMGEDKESPGAANGVATQQTGSEAGIPGKAASATSSEHQQIARDLDMLAETVRTIVSSVNDQENGAENEEQSIDDGQAGSSDDEESMPIPDDVSLTEDKTSVPGADETKGAALVPDQHLDTDPTVARGEHGEYSLEVCQLVVAKYADGETHKQIASELSMPATSVQTIIKKAKRKGAVLPAQRAGRPRATSETLEKTIQDLVKANPTMSARAVQAHLANINMLDVSFETIRRRVRDCRKKLQAGGGDAEQGNPSSDSDEGKELAPPTGLVPTSSVVVPLQPIAVSPSSSGGGIASVAFENGENQQIPPAKRRKYGEYSTEVREACVHKHEIEGLTYATISSQLNIPHDTVRAIVRKAKKTGTVRTAPRSGRPRKTSDIVDKVIIQAVKANQRCTAKMIQEDLWTVFNVKVSCETVRRRVKANTKQRLLSSLPPPLEPEQASSSTLPQPISSAMSSFMSTQMPSSVVSLTPAAVPGNFPPTQFTNNLAVLTPLPLPLPIYQPNTLSVSAFGGSHGALQSLLNSQTQQQQQMAPLLGNTSVSVTTPKKTTITNATANDSSILAEDSTETSKARKKRNDYSVEIREQCVSMHAQGQGYRRIGQELKMPHTTVRAIVEKVQRTGTVLPAARSGRPRKTDEIVDKVILQAVKNNEKCSARMIQEELQDAYGVKVSCETIRRRVKDHSRQRHHNNSSSSELPISDVTESSQIHDFGFGILPPGPVPAPVPQHIPQTGPLRSFRAQLQGASQFSEYTTVL